MRTWTPAPVRSDGMPALSTLWSPLTSDQTATGFAFPESVAYDADDKVLYVSEFGSELKPAEKDGQGRISKVSLTGKIIDKQFLPAPGGTLNKPKVQSNRLRVTDTDIVWVFDLKTRRGKKVELPGIKFANDVAVRGNVLYVSDNRADQLYRVEPADFLEGGDPKVTVVFSGKSINPNGLYPARDGSLLMVGFLSPQQARGIYALGADGAIKNVARDLGRLDGVFEMDDGTVLVTEWNSGSLSRWSSTTGMEPLAKGFKGRRPAEAADDETTAEA